MLQSTVKIEKSYGTTRVVLTKNNGRNEKSNFAEAEYRQHFENIKRKKYRNRQKSDLEKKLAKGMLADNVTISRVAGEYEKQVEKSLRDKIKSDTKIHSNEFKAKSAQRSKQRIRKLVWLNACKNMYFVTLTYNVEPKTYKDASKDIRNLERTVKRHCGDKAKLIAVCENGEELGRVHWHLIVFDINKDLNWWTKHGWRKGEVNIKNIRAVKGMPTVEKVANYIAKYITKGEKCFADQTRQYLVSKNMKRTNLKTICSDSDIEILMKQIMSLNTLSTRTFEYKINGQKQTKTDIYFKNNEIDNVINIITKNGLKLYEHDILRPSKKEIIRKDFQKSIISFIADAKEPMTNVDKINHMHKCAVAFYGECDIDLLVKGLREANDGRFTVPNVLFFDSWRLMKKFCECPIDFIKNHHYVFEIYDYKVIVRDDLNMFLPMLAEQATKKI